MTATCPLGPPLQSPPQKNTQAQRKHLVST